MRSFLGPWSLGKAQKATSSTHDDSERTIKQEGWLPGGPVEGIGGTKFDAGVEGCQMVLQVLSTEKAAERQVLKTELKEP